MSIDDIKRRHAAAAGITAWEHWPYGPGSHRCISDNNGNLIAVVHEQSETPIYSEAIVLAHEDRAELLDEVDRLTRELATAERSRADRVTSVDGAAAAARKRAAAIGAVRRLCRSYTPEPPPIFRGPGLSEHGEGFNHGTRTLAEAVLSTLSDLLDESGEVSGLASPEAGLSLTELLVLHEWDEQVFGGFLCLTCTPDAAHEDPDLVVAWPCPPLRAAGLTDEGARDVVLRHRAVIEAGARGEAAQPKESTVAGEGL